MEDYKNMSIGALAFLGDSVFELMVREALVKTANRPSGDLHAEKVQYVSAAAQAEAFKIIENVLTEEELDVYKRGRNAHTTHTPKNMTNAQYHAATGFETLFGYLYLKDDKARLEELFKMIYKN